MGTQSVEAGRLNLTLERGPSVWSRVDRRSSWLESADWSAIGLAVGAALSAWSVLSRRGRSRTTALIWSSAWGVAAALAFKYAPDFWITYRQPDDVDKTSLDSFPASDAPSSRQVG